MKNRTLIGKMVSFAFDTAGRLWVTTASEYPADIGRKKDKTTEEYAKKLWKYGGRDKVVIFDTPWAKGI